MEPIVQIPVRQEIIKSFQTYAKKKNKDVVDYINDVLFNLSLSLENRYHEVAPITERLTGILKLDEEAIIKEYYEEQEREKNDPTFVAIPEDERRKLLQDPKYASMSPFVKKWAFRYRLTKDIDTKELIRKARWERFVEKNILGL